MTVMPLQPYPGRVQAIKMEDRKSVQESRRIALKERVREEINKEDCDVKAVLATLLDMV